MNNYIIDPAIFYWINVFSIIQTVSALIGTMMTLGGIICFIAYIYYKDGHSYYSDTDKLNLTTKRFHKASLILMLIGVPLVLISIFIPGKETSIEMLIARTATFENTELTVKGIKEVIDYIVTAIKSVV